MKERPAIGSRWSDTRRDGRLVEVIPGWDEGAWRVRIKNVETGRKTWAQISRFGAKDGYLRSPRYAGDRQ